MMVELWVIFVMLCLLIATASALVALRLQYRLLDKTRQEREAWQQAQEGRQRTWEVRQGKHILDAEKKLADQLKETRREWRAWSVEVEQTHQTWLERADIEKEVARLPHVEQLELPLGSGNGQRLPPAGWRPPQLYQADLRGRDLSYRYMEHADLREARLAGANFYMADLAGALLTGANLENANLTGANLCGADLRAANLAGASFLVTDLHHALLYGAILLGARHLSIRQLQVAFYDSTTVLDSSLDATLPRLPGIQVSPVDLSDISHSVQESAPERGVSPAESPVESPDAQEPDASAVQECPPEPEPVREVQDTQEWPVSDASAAQECPPEPEPAHEVQDTQEWPVSDASAVQECPPEAGPAHEVQDTQEWPVSDASAVQECPPEAGPVREVQDTQEWPVSDASAAQECPPEAGPAHEVLAETREQSEQTESGKIIQLSVHAARSARQPGAEKRTGAAKGGGRKSKGTSGRSRKSSG
jgi:hypothetical protein